MAENPGITLGGRPPLPFFENKSALIFEKKTLIVSILRLGNVVLKISRRKNPQNILLQDYFFLNFWGHIYRSALISQNFPCLEKCLVVHLRLWPIFTKNSIIGIWHGSKDVTGIQLNIQFTRALAWKQKYCFFGLR